MTGRGVRLGTFLARAGWGGARRTPLAGDASQRHYERLTRADGATAVLMDAPPDESLDAFVSVAGLLAGLGFRTPAIHAEDRGAGLLLLEDFGDTSFTALLADARDGALEKMLYEAATDLLVALHRRPAPRGLLRYDAAWLLRDASLFLACGPGARPGANDRARRGFADAWQHPLDLVAEARDVLCLRDFHAGNLMWLPARGTGDATLRDAQRIGLLDFQDARAAPAAYDLVSLLQDARRDLAPGLEDAMTTRYLAASRAHDEPRFRAVYGILGAQRSIRILGVFSRLAERDGKRAYLSHLPRVWNHLEANLAHPALAPVRAWFDRWVPERGQGAAA